MFAGTGNGLYVSDDAGDTWTLVGMPDKGVWQIRDNGEGVLYAGTAPTGLYRSEDCGNSWHEVETLSRLAEENGWCIPLDPPIPASARALVVSGQELWVGVEVGGIAISSDAGENWSTVLPGDNPDLHMIFAHPERKETNIQSMFEGMTLGPISQQIQQKPAIPRHDLPPRRSQDSIETFQFKT